MARIVVDRKQNATVVALCIVLVGAVGVTAFRVSGAKSGKPTLRASAKPTAVSDTQPNDSMEMYPLPGSNPFAKPGGIVSSEAVNVSNGEDTPLTRIRVSGTEDATVEPWLPPGMQHIQRSGDAARMPGIAPSPNTVTTDAVTDSGGSERPAAAADFTLLATATGKEGHYAVIRTSDGASRIVKVGDRVEGYVVKELRSASALLTKGAATVVARRPGLQRSKDESSQRSESAGPVTDAR